MITTGSRSDLTSSEPRGESRAMIQISTRSGLWARYRPLCLRNDFPRGSFLRWRRSFGSLFHGDARRSHWFPYSIHGWLSDNEPTWHTIPGRHVRHKCVGLVLDRPADDATYRETAGKSELAIFAGRRFSRRVHDLLQLRVGNAQFGEGRRQVARSLQYCRKSVAWIRCRVVRFDHGRKTLTRQLFKGGLHAVEGCSKKSNDICQ